MSQVPSTPVRVLITSPFETDQVERIRDAYPRQIHLIYEESLIARPRFPADHKGVRPNLSSEDLERWLDLLNEAEVLLDLDWYAPQRMAELAPNVRWVQGTHSGIANILGAAGLDQNDEVVFTTAAGVHGIPLAEFAITGLLYFVKGLPRLLNLQGERTWDQQPSQELAGRKVLVVGLGGVGQQVVDRCHALGMEVWGARRSPDRPSSSAMRSVPYSSIGDVLPEMDAVVLACPLTEETRGLLGREELASLKPTAVLVNIARGPVLDEEFLIAALRERRILGAALDVFNTEPLPADNPLWGLDNVLISPHSAGLVEKENARIVDIFIENLGRYLEGKPLLNIFEPQRGY